MRSLALKLIAFGFLVSCIFLVGCETTNTTPVSTKNPSLTHGNVQMNVKVGVTTKTEVLEIFGAPNITTVDGSGREVWTYQRAAQVSESKSSDSYWTVILLGGLGGSSQASGVSTSSSMITLIIKFNEEQIVSDFRSRSSTF